ncbi:cardiolipin synthase ClsB [Aquabacterium sp. J223]|uniref:cardiolipin synthase ClsB n=1 Tax=Aquabacterium sp. J223 TaxID=2898431 RepID=UPI0021AD5D8F|nr:cardiolipin synthase ClsB [Aquabacterium sp. J223]UUX97498.1 cardiolipin synthase ClsB [Aquabacterium sp. J223]
MRRDRGWIEGNRLQLLENGEAYYPSVFDAIAKAEHEILIETFILFDDKVGQALRELLIEAGQRGVSVDLTVDSYGSPDLSDEFIGGLTAAGVRVHVFDHAGKLFGRWRTNLLRRLHRKLVVIDGRIGYVGGINFSADHLGDYGPEAKQDYAVRVEGPVVEHIHRFLLEQLPPAQPRPRFWRAARIVRQATQWPGWRPWRQWQEEAPDLPAVGGARALFVTRDNHQHRTDIERHYRIAIRAARRQITIANAYFFPGYRLLREMRRAAKRGVDVRLILQGNPDMAIVPVAARMLYGYLVPAGVSVHEYCRRPLHGKVAVVDDEWATVGSSNLDPLSLSLNLESNLFIRDREFARLLRERLDLLVQHHCQAVAVDHIPKRTAWRALLGAVVFHVVRHFPDWAGWLPRHAPRLTSLGEAPPPAPPATTTPPSPGAQVTR